MNHYLEFETPVKKLDQQIENLTHANEDPDVSVDDEIKRLFELREKQLVKLYSSLKPWDVVRIARHPQRPHSVDYIDHIITDFQELHGDRCFGDDHAIICGFGRLKGRPIALLAQEKGRSTGERVFRNFGMVRAEGYRKAQRIMRLAEQFQLPVVSLIDTPGAYPGIDAEERGISEAIASNLAVMSHLNTPFVSMVIGEGSSGGALGIGIGDYLCMLQYSTYFVISPEGCANIIWKTIDKAPDAASAMGVTSEALLELGLIDGIIEEPTGGAHRNHSLIAAKVADRLDEILTQLAALPGDQLLEKRCQHLRNFGNPRPKQQ